AFGCHRDLLRDFAQLHPERQIEVIRYEQRNILTPHLAKARCGDFDVICARLEVWKGVKALRVRLSFRGLVGGALYRAHLGSCDRRASFVGYLASNGGPKILGVHRPRQRCKAEGERASYLHEVPRRRISIRFNLLSRSAICQMTKRFLEGRSYRLYDQCRISLHPAGRATIWDKLQEVLMKPFVLLTGLAISLAVIGFTQAPTAQKAPQKKGTPPHQLTADERKQIEAKADELSGMIRNLRSARADEALLPDVEVFESAARTILEHPEEFF